MKLEQPKAGHRRIDEKRVHHYWVQNLEHSTFGKGDIRHKTHAVTEALAKEGRITYRKAKKIIHEVGKEEGIGRARRQEFLTKFWNEFGMEGHGVEHDAETSHHEAGVRLYSKGPAGISPKSETGENRTQKFLEQREEQHARHVRGERRSIRESLLGFSGTSGSSGGMNQGPAPRPPRTSAGPLFRMNNPQGPRPSGPRPGAR